MSVRESEAKPIMYDPDNQPDPDNSNMVNADKIFET